MSNKGIKPGQVWTYLSSYRAIDVYLITGVNEDGTASMVDLRSLDQYVNIRVNLGVRGHGWKRVT